MYLCYQNLPGIYKPPVLSKLSIHRPASTLTTLLSKTSPAPQDLSAPLPAALDDPYERILLLEVLERHQEHLYYCSWLIHAQSTAAVPVPHCSCAPRAPQLAVFPGGSHAQSTAAVPVPPCSCPPREPQLSVSPAVPMPSRPLMFLYLFARVHQEDCSSSLAGSRPLLKNVLTNALSVSSKHFDCHCHLPRSILVAQVT